MLKLEYQLSDMQAQQQKKASRVAQHLLVSVIKKAQS